MSFTLGLLPGIQAMAAASSGESRSAEIWHVSHVDDPSTKKFAYCAVESGFDNGLYLAFARNRELNTNIVVSFPDKHLEEKTKFRMLVGIDNNPVREVVGFSADANTLVLPLQHDRKIISWLESGKLLELKGPMDSAKFALDGAGNALHQLQLCVEDNLKNETTSAGGKPAARPQIAAGPLASNEAPVDDQMVEPLQLPASRNNDELPTPTPAPTATPAITAPVVIAAAPKPASPPVQVAQADTSPGAAARIASAQSIEQTDEEAARAEAARLQKIRQAAQIAAPAAPTVAPPAVTAPAPAVVTAAPAQLDTSVEDAARAQAAKDLAAKDEAAKKAADEQAARDTAIKQAADDAAREAAAQAEATRKAAAVEAAKKAAAQAEATKQAADEQAARDAAAKKEADQAAQEAAIQAEAARKAAAEQAEAAKQVALKEQAAREQAARDAAAKAQAEAAKAAQLKADQEAAARAEADRAAAAAAKLKADQEAAMKQEADRAAAAAKLKADQDAAARAEADRLAAAAKLKADQDAAARIEADRLAAAAKEQAAKEEIARQARIEAAAREQAMRDAAAQAEAARAETAKVEAAKADAAKARDAQLQAADDEAAKAALARLKSAQPAAPMQMAAAQPQQIKPQGSVTPPMNPAVSLVPDQQAARPTAIPTQPRTIAAVAPQQMASAAKPAMVLDQEAVPMQMAPARSTIQQAVQQQPVQQPVQQAAPPQPAPQRITEVAPPVEAPLPATAQAVRPPVNAAVLAPAASAVRPIDLSGVLQQSGINAARDGRLANAYVWNTGVVTGRASEGKAGSSFINSMLDDLDQQEKRCKGQFSSSIEAPVDSGGMTYSEVATGCGSGGGKAGIILYYQKAGKFGIVTQETSSPDRSQALATREQLKNSLQIATNYK